MAALPTLNGAASAGPWPDTTPHVPPNGEDQQLAALRSLLVGPLARELETLRRRVADIEDPQQLTCKLAEQLPQALALRPATDKQMAAALSPLLKATLWEMRQRGDPAAGGTFRETFKLGLRQVRSGVADIAHAVLGRFAADAQLVRLRLIHRRQHALIEEFIGIFEEPDARDTRNMLDLLQDKLRDPEILHAYADYQGYLRKTIEETFAGSTVLSLSGAAGDHHPLLPESGFAQAEKMGRSLGSLAIARTYDAIHVDYDTALRTAWRDITLPAKDQRTIDLHPEPFDRERLTAMLKANPNRPAEIPVKIALLGIGPLLLACTPGEPVAELGAMIKWACPFLKTYPLFQATDSAGYIPTANQYLWGGYEPTVSPFAQGAGEKLVHEIVAAAYHLLQKSPLAIPPRRPEVIGYAGR